MSDQKTRNTDLLNERISAATGGGGGLKTNKDDVITPRRPA